MGFSQGPSIVIHYLSILLTLVIFQEVNSYVHMSNAIIPQECTTSSRLARSIWA